MKNFTISKKDIKLLLILLSLIILGGTYQFVYLENMGKVEVMNGDITILEGRLSELQQKVNDRETILTENASIQQEIDGILGRYGNGATEEKSLMIVKSLEENSDIIISTVTFTEPEYFFNGTNLTGAVEQGAQVESVSNVELVSTVNVEEGSVEVGQSSPPQILIETQDSKLAFMSGYRTTLGITFRASYEGLKNCINFINNYPEKSNVGDITLSYDTETGNLSGTMSINLYQILGPGRSYQEPVIDSEDIGTPNIFGTIEVPVNGQPVE